MATFKGDPDYNALSPQTTKGDLAVYGAAGSTRVPVGADGLFLKADSTKSTGMTWASPAGSALNVVTLSGATTLTSDVDHVLAAAGTSTGYNIALYSPSGNSGKVLKITKTDNTFWPIGITGLGLRSGVTLIGGLETIQFICDGATFYPFNRYVSGGWNSINVSAGTWINTVGPSAPIYGTSLFQNTATYRLDNSGYANLRWDFYQGNAGTAGGGSLYVINLPWGMIMDTSRLGVNTGDGGATGTAYIGPGRICGQTSEDGVLYWYAYSSTQIYGKGFNAVNAPGVGLGAFGPAYKSFNTSFLQIHFDLKIPLLNYSVGNGW